MINNEKLEDFNSITLSKNDIIFDETKVTENYIHSSVRSKIFNNWEKGLQNTINPRPQSPAFRTIDANKEKTIKKERKRSPKKTTKTPLLNDKSNEESIRHMIDTINSVVNNTNNDNNNSDQQIIKTISNGFNSSETFNNLSSNMCLNNDCLTDNKLNSINDLNNTSINNEIKPPFDSIVNNSDINLNTINNYNNINNKSEEKPKRKRKKCDKSVSEIKNNNNEKVKKLLKKNISANEKVKEKLKVKLPIFDFNPNISFDKSLLSYNPNNNAVTLKGINNNSDSNGLIKNNTFINTIINDNDFKVKKKRIRKKTQIAVNGNNTNDTKSLAEKNPFMDSFQKFLTGNKGIDDKVSVETGVNITTNDNKIKIININKKKTQSQIHAEKAVKKSREIKSNSGKIIRRITRTKPLCVKGLISQKSFLAFIGHKFPQIKEGVPFIQDRSCKDFKKDFPLGISFCIDCNDDKKGDIQTCRFYQYRTLIKNGDKLSVYGFAEPDNATQADSKVWLPGGPGTQLGLDINTAKFVLTFVGKELCKIFTEEEKIIKDSEAYSITWKKPVKGIRELCDVCQTTIFNTHWVCPTCGYAVCIDCYQYRVNKGVINGHNRRNHDGFGWLLCNNKVKHDIKNFHLALFITKLVFGLINYELHKLRHNFDIMGQCFCQPLDASNDIYNISITSNQLENMFQNVPQQWFCDERLLILKDPKCIDNLRLFQIQWLRGDPVMVQNVHLSLTHDLWTPNSFNKNFGKQTSRLVDCMNGKTIPKRPMSDFWNGFEDIKQRLIDQETGDEMLLKLKDWPPNAEFRDKLPLWFDNLMESLPLKEYTRYDGIRNLASRLPEFFVRPDLGPKMYCAYGSVMYPNKGTTNLHLDMSDAINVMIYVGIAQENDKPLEEHYKEANDALLKAGCDQQMVNRVNECGRKVGALWHIFRAEDAPKIRDLLTRVAEELHHRKEVNNDPIHDQSWYLDEVLRQRLYDEYKVKGFAVAQCLGDAILIPSGAPHQVRNLHSCIKVAGEFVSPENIGHSVRMTQEFRKLSDRHNNHEDKLQIKNIIYHSVKDAILSLSLSLLYASLPTPPVLSIPPQPLTNDINPMTSMPTLKPESPVPHSPPVTLPNDLNSHSSQTKLQSSQSTLESSEPPLESSQPTLESSQPTLESSQPILKSSQSKLEAESSDLTFSTTSNSILNVEISSQVSDN